MESWFYFQNITKRDAITQHAVLRNWVGKVIAQTFVHPLSVSGNPNGVQSNPQLRKVVGTLAAVDSVVGQRSEKLNIKRNINFRKGHEF